MIQSIVETLARMKINFGEEMADNSFIKRLKKYMRRYIKQLHRIDRLIVFVVH